MLPYGLGIHADDVLGQFPADFDAVEVLLIDGVGDFGESDESAVSAVEGPLSQSAADRGWMNVEAKVEPRPQGRGGGGGGS